MVIDTSALLAILFDEPEREAFVEAITTVERTLVSAATLVETSIVLEHRVGPGGVRDFDLLLDTARIETVAVDAAQALVARDAYRRYGKGRHRAALNLGDCFSYALARVESRPLLFKGDDFAHTDVPPFR